QQGPFSGIQVSEQRILTFRQGHAVDTQVGVGVEERGLVRPHAPDRARFLEGVRRSEDLSPFHGGGVVDDPHLAISEFYGSLHRRTAASTRSHVLIFCGLRQGDSRKQQRSHSNTFHSQSGLPLSTEYISRYEVLGHTSGMNPPFCAHLTP